MSESAFDRVARHVDGILNAHGILRAVDDDDAWCWQLGENRVYLGADDTDLGYSIALHRHMESDGESYWNCDHGSDRYVESPAAPELLAQVVEQRLNSGT